MRTHWLWVVMALTVAACGGTATADDAEGVATLSGDLVVGDEAAIAEVDAETQLMLYTECMRDQGIDLSDPEVDADGNVRPGRPDFEGGQPDDAFRDTVQEARQACDQFLEGVTLGFERFQDAEFQDQLLAFAACMREQGVDVADPDFSGDVQRGRGLFGEGFDPNDPDTQDALELCQSELPGQFGAGGGPGRGPGGGS